MIRVDHLTWLGRRLRTQLTSEVLIRVAVRGVWGVLVTPFHSGETEAQEVFGLNISYTGIFFFCIDTFPPPGGWQRPSMWGWM